jgi:hypothetical protein
MKNRITLTVAAALSLFAVGAQAQLDTFAGARTILALPPQVITAVVSNVVDVHSYDGVAKIDLVSATRDAANVTTFTLAGSATRTGTYTTIATFALGVPTTVPYTNTAAGGATNYLYLAGTLTTPTASTAGWASQYIVPSAFTTSGSIALTGCTNGVLGFNIADVPRYLSITATPTMSTSNTVMAVITAYPAR